MPPPLLPTLAEHLYWAYANLAMAEMAVHNQEAGYSRKHFMVRARLYAGLNKGTMSPRSLMRDQKIRMKLPQECLYCGSGDDLSIDHVVPTERGGADSGDNALWACRTCNSSKSDKDLFEWWFDARAGFPPLFAVRVYLKQAIGYSIAKEIMNCPLAEVEGHPFVFNRIPTDYPKPEVLIFSPAHARRAKDADGALGKDRQPETPAPEPKAAPIRRTSALSDEEWRARSKKLNEAVRRALSNVPPERQGR